MIGERILKRWRKDALVDKKLVQLADTSLINVVDYIQAQDRILKLTQELLDQHLMKGYKNEFD